MNNSSDLLTISIANPNSEKAPQKIKKKTKFILALLLGCNLAGNMLFTNVAAILPPYASHHRHTFDSFTIGVLFASY